MKKYTTSTKLSKKVHIFVSVKKYTHCYQYKLSTLSMITLNLLSSKTIQIRLLVVIPLDFPSYIIYKY